MLDIFLKHFSQNWRNQQFMGRSGLVWILFLHTNCRVNLRHRLDCIYCDQRPSRWSSCQIVSAHCVTLILMFQLIFVSFLFPIRFIHKAWRLVVPAIVCFTILTIFSAVYAGILNSRLNDFCDEFKSKFKNKNVPCELLITRFSLNDDTAWSPAMNFILCKFFSWLTVLLWLLAALIMLMRCILGADFNIEEVENYIEAYGTELEPDAETLDTKLQFKDAVRRYSHERIYKPTTKEPERVAGEKWSIKVKGFLVVIKSILGF